MRTGRYASCYRGIHNLISILSLLSKYIKEHDTVGFETQLRYVLKTQLRYVPLYIYLHIRMTHIKVNTFFGFIQKLILFKVA